MRSAPINRFARFAAAIILAVLAWLDPGYAMAAVSCLMTAPGFCCETGSDCEWCTALPASILIETSGIGGGADCCADVDGAWQLFETEDPCVFEFAGSWGIDCGEGGFASGLILITATIAEEDASNVRLTVHVLIHRGSPFFDTIMEFEFAGIFTKPVDCSAWDAESLTLQSFSNSAALPCDEGTISMTVTSDP